MVDDSIEKKECVTIGFIKALTPAVSKIYKLISIYNIGTLTLVI